jgi:uncharacterized protein (TIGR00251 family)
VGRSGWRGTSGYGGTGSLYGARARPPAGYRGREWQAGPVTDDVFDVGSDGSVVLRLHVVPGAGRTAVTGRHGDALKVRVAAPPEKGRANDACLALVAGTLGVASGQLELVGGPSSRSKRVRVTGMEAAEVRRLVAAALGAPGGGGPADDRPVGNAGPIRGVR